MAAKRRSSTGLFRLTFVLQKPFPEALPFFLGGILQ
jgi:hypothetical protein